jgi:hypothetical protein
MWVQFPPGAPFLKGKIMWYLVAYVILYVVSVWALIDFWRKEFDVTVADLLMILGSSLALVGVFLLIGKLLKGAAELVGVNFSTKVLKRRD